MHVSNVHGEERLGGKLKRRWVAMKNNDDMEDFEDDERDIIMKNTPSSKHPRLCKMSILEECLVDRLKLLQKFQKNLCWIMHQKR